MAEPTQVFSGFRALPTKLSEKHSNGHILYFKEHSVRDPNPEKPADKTLFVVNVPPYADENCLRNVFSSCGPVEKVYFHKVPTSGVPTACTSNFFRQEENITGFKVAYVVFKKKSGVFKAKKLSTSNVKCMSAAATEVKTGIAKWCEEYKNDQELDTEELQQEIDTYMADYDNKVEEEKRKAKEDDGQADDDGWVTVTRHGRNKGVPRTEAHEKRVTSKDKKKQKEKELLSFYTFQIRETKKKQLADLREKFEEDKNKIALMRQQRKFKPY